MPASLSTPVVLQIAVPAPLFQVFEYLPPANLDVSRLQPGMRLTVPFGRSHCTGILLGTSQTPLINPTKLKRAQALLDDAPLLPADLLQLCLWAAEYYHHPVGEVLATALPVRLRDGGAAKPARSCVRFRSSERSGSRSSLRRSGT